MKLTHFSLVIYTLLQSVSAAEIISVELKALENDKIKNKLFEYAQKRVQEKLTKLPKPEIFTPKIRHHWICGTTALPPIVIPEKQYYFYSSKKRESWIPITGEYRKEQIWAVDSN